MNQTTHTFLHRVTVAAAVLLLSGAALAQSASTDGEIKKVDAAAG